MLSIVCDAVHHVHDSTHAFSASARSLQKKVGLKGSKGTRGKELINIPKAYLLIQMLIKEGYNTV